MGDDTTVLPLSLYYQKKHEYTQIHRHAFVEFSYVTRGHGQESINEESHELGPGSFSLVSPYQLHTIRADPGEELSFHLGAISLGSLYEPRSLLGGLPALLFREGAGLAPQVRFEGAQAASLSALFDRMEDAFASPAFADRLLFQALLVEAFVAFDRARGGVYEASARMPAPDASEEFWRVVEYVQANFGEELSLARLSERFGMSASSISRSFSLRFGIHYLDYLRALRIQSACALLGSSDMSVTDIAYEAGFQSSTTFNRAFHRITGKSPRRFRQDGRRGR